MLSVESVAAAEIEPIVGKLRREIYPSHGEADGGTADVIGHRIAHHLGCFFAQIHVLVVFVSSGFKGVEQGDHRHGGKVDGKVAKSLITWPNGISMPWHEIDRIAAAHRGLHGGEAVQQIVEIPRQIDW